MDKKYPEFCARLQRLLDASEFAGEGQRAIANRFGVHVSMLNGWLNGHAMPTMERAIVIAEVLDCCVEYLLTGMGPSRPSTNDFVDVDLLTEDDLSPLIKKRLTRDIYEAFEEMAREVTLEANRSRKEMLKIIAKYKAKASERRE